MHVPGIVPTAIARCRGDDTSGTDGRLACRFAEGRFAEKYDLLWVRRGRAMVATPPPAPLRCRHGADSADPVIDRRRWRPVLREE
ncbi:hypothetical protein Francci3_3739 [Frankia casuarinae]|uniref:Uncharacterized protein n=1 Tax=Frankia casuarinae (strain DSM 45818 / CECT 9043 / HFP020203 / CcI3) TaxID=106370 RepID=Q2J6K2_FRACC|nr:hypothetical protein Francci3_3739 [Frankia casuarinae]